ncbi:hypothetical protein LEP1GSC005_3714 [Leptospira santarosai str. ST188]|uniref:Uncharacterized protein n=1 Tax=Leptospira santarosai str. ZUN179 TaxID=1049985 RepID=M6URK5_9LEPT|nr:hypothetical protein LEP1GSC071_1959 [Leptospira santarosai str. JET]EMF91921.1 hypothetical protein LEP1GSC005_3714 [Leptospira santarosai str. ST188]EMO43674.1 hypothetical protein LEP1GSC187_3023 [Leptospira santarosai str. ZUN179]
MNIHRFLYFSKNIFFFVPKDEILSKINPKHPRTKIRKKAPDGAKNKTFSILSLKH